MPDARQRRERLLLAAVLLAGALWLGWERWASHDAVGRAERAHLAAQARALEENLRPQLVAAYLTLRRLQAALALLPPAQWGPSLAPRLAPLSEALAGVRSIEITDAAGRWVAGGGDPGAPTAAQAPPSLPLLPSLGSRPSAAVLYLDAVPGPGPTTALLTLAVLDAEGRRVGAVSAALDPAYFGALLSSVLDAADMQAAIVQGPGRLLAWQAADAASGLQPAPGAGAWMAQRLPDAAGTPGASALALAGRPPRLVAQRILQARGLPLAQPLVLVVSRDLRALYAPWWHRTAIYVALYLLLAGAALAAGLRLQRRQAEMRQLSRATQREREIDAERLALALQGGDLALWDLSLPGGQTVVNDRWFSMLGLARGDVEPGVEGWLSLLHPDDRAAARAAQDAHLAGATPAYEASYRMRHRDGRWRWVLDRGRVVERDAQGRARRMVGTHLDLTPQMEAEQALRDREAQLSNVIDALPGPASRLDAQGRYTFANAAFERWFGLAGAQLLGRDWRSLVRPEAQPKIGGWLERACAGETVSFDHRMPALHGERDVIVTLVPDRDAAGAVLGCFVIVTDITERKRADAERQALEAQLREAQKMESIGTLAGGIAHDFNNILAAILGNVALARGDLPPGHAVASSLDQIDRAALRARSLVQQILTFSRRQRNPLRVQPLRPVVDESLALLRATLPASVRLALVLPDDPVQVEADTTQLQQVLLNLCTNAWHALPEGRGRIEIGFEALPDTPALAPLRPALRPGPAVHLWVRDDGAGMDGATRERIFDPFFTTKPVGQGTGLGLAVVHGIVRHHGGVIRVDSEPGAGSTFHVYLPGVGPAAVAPQPGPATPPERRGRGQRLLVVDDDEVMVLMAQRLLERAGYRVTTAPGLAQALAAVAAAPAPFDLVISDYNMPEGSGLDLAEALQRERPGLPVVLSSGYLTDELAERAARIGVRGLLKKENSFEELTALVDAVLAPPPVA